MDWHLLDRLPDGLVDGMVYRLLSGIEVEPSNGVIDGLVVRMLVRLPVRQALGQGVRPHDGVMDGMPVLSVHALVYAP
jgi:hypothetical protein